MQDIVPMTWVDGVSALSDATFNQEIRDSYLLLLNPPTCVLGRSTNQSIPTGTGWTAISWDTPATFDTEDSTTPMFSASFPTRITVQTPGWYECILNVSGLLPLNIVLTAAIRINGGATPTALGSVIGQSTSVHKIISASMMFSFAAGDYAEVVVNHNSGTACSLEALANIPNFTLYRRRGI